MRFLQHLLKKSYIFIFLFFESGAVSRDLADAQGAVVENGVVKPRKIMESLLQSAYKCYVEEHGQSLSFASFKKLRPHTVLPFTTHKFRECLSEYCVKVDLKIRAVNSHLVSLPHLCTEDRYQASGLTLCPKDLGAEYKKACLDRECPSCGVGHLRDYLQLALDDKAIQCSPATW